MAPTISPTAVKHALVQAGGSVTGAARTLGIESASLRRLVHAQPLLADTVFEEIEREIDAAQQVLWDALDSDSVMTRMRSASYILRHVEAGECVGRRVVKPQNLRTSRLNGSTSVQTQRRRAASSRVNMTAEESLSVAVRGHLSGAGAMSEVKMFGGTGFLLNGNLAAAVSKRGLLLRVGKDRYRDALAWPGARPMEMRGRTMEGYVYIDPPMPTNDALKAWLDEAVAFVKTLPVKAAGAKPKRHS
jgi:TfoX/Sxy family transcriptional regulator of competence genes